MNELCVPSATPTPLSTVLGNSYSLEPELNQVLTLISAFWSYHRHSTADTYAASGAGYVLMKNTASLGLAGLKRWATSKWTNVCTVWGSLFLWVLCPSYPSTAAQRGPESLRVVGETHFCQHPSPTNFLGLTEKEDIQLMVFHSRSSPSGGLMS